MRIVACTLALASLALTGGAALAQADADDVVAVMDAMLDGARAGDQEAVGEQVHDQAVFCFDPDKGIESKDDIIGNVAAEPLPEDFGFGAWEVEVLGDIALAMSPVTLPAEMGLTLKSLGMGAILVRVEDKWQIIAAAFLFSDLENENLPAEVQTHFDSMAPALQTFMQSLQQAAAGGDSAAFSEICAEDAVFVGASEPGGPVEVVALEELMALGDEMGEISMAPAVPANEELLMGFGVAALAIDMDVTVGDADPVLMTEMVLAAYVPDEDKFEIIMAIEAPAE